MRLMDLARESATEQSIANAEAAARSAARQTEDTRQKLAAHVWPVPVVALDVRSVAVGSRLDPEKKQVFLVGDDDVKVVAIYDGPHPYPALLLPCDTCGVQHAPERAGGRTISAVPPFGETPVRDDAETRTAALVASIGRVIERHTGQVECGPCKARRTVATCNGCGRGW